MSDETVHLRYKRLFGVLPCPAERKRLAPANSALRAREECCFAGERWWEALRTRDLGGYEGLATEAAGDVEYDIHAGGAVAYYLGDRVANGRGGVEQEANRHLIAARQALREGCHLAAVFCAALAQDGEVPPYVREAAHEVARACGAARDMADGRDGSRGTGWKNRW